MGRFKKYYWKNGEAGFVDETFRENYNLACTIDALEELLETTEGDVFPEVIRTSIAELNIRLEELDQKNLQKVGKLKEIRTHVDIYIDDYGTEAAVNKINDILGSHNLSYQICESEEKEHE